ncbi:hypothetical protein V3C99_011499, partial [Haemonchus contortus]|uniref:Ovule protein n=1 Tax=Haemonchus contortus TaxID=6289 RepID=A0A7I4Y794_HAECO
FILLGNRASVQLRYFFSVNFSVKNQKFLKVDWQIHCFIFLNEFCNENTVVRFSAHRLGHRCRTCRD